MPPSALRDRKRERTRRALLEAAVDMFEERGYEATTVADIAATAEVGTRTFFNYFASKEELLFPEPDERVTSAVRAIDSRRPGERPVEVLLRALRAAGDNPGDHLGDTLAARIAVVRAQVSRTVPAVSGRAAHAQLAAQQEIAKQLRVAFPEELDEVGSAALVGAVVGAVSGALTVLFQDPQCVEDPATLQRRIQETTNKVLAPWLSQPRPTVDAAREAALEARRPAELPGRPATELLNRPAAEFPGRAPESGVCHSAELPRRLGGESIRPIPIHHLPAAEQPRHRETDHELGRPEDALV
ncbi:TetR/AcrR family transcriptional regulator [Nocardia sp. IFM 10818]